MTASIMTTTDKLTAKVRAARIFAAYAVLDDTAVGDARDGPCSVQRACGHM
jgi:hypothetical protein